MTRFIWTEKLEGWELRTGDAAIYAGNVFAHPGQRPYAATWNGRSCVTKTVEAAKKWLERQTL